MKIKNMTHDANRISFNIKDVEVPMLNALRRTVISEIPALAIETVVFTTNTSIMGDELLSHRLGLIPLKTDPKLFNNIADCTCKGKGCGKCTVKLTLKADGPKTVYSGDIAPADGESSPVSDTFPIIKLTQSQHLDLEATAQLGIGKDHAKWQAGIASYEEKDDGSYDVFIESYGQLPIKTLVESAFNTFQSKIEQLKEELK
jgi:DNA-directed RNA polymerase subunit D